MEGVHQELETPDTIDDQEIFDGEGQRVKIWILIFIGLIISGISFWVSTRWKPNVVETSMKSLTKIAHVATSPLFGPDEKCNDHGVSVPRGITRLCICDLGYSGTGCGKKVDITNPAGAIREKTVLMVIDSFSSVDLEGENSIYYTTMANFLGKQGYKVTVLIVGPPSSTYDQMKKFYSSKNIELTRLPEYTLRFGGSLFAVKSHKVMRFILEESRSRGGPWEMIMFHGSEGIGYHTIQSQRQGLLCIGSHFVVVMDGLTRLRRQQLRKGSKQALVTDEDALASDYLQQRATEMADTVVVSSKSILDMATESGWKISDQVYILPYLTVPVANEKTGEIERSEELIPGRQTQVKEFVYVGGLGTVGGLNVFLNAIENILQRDQKAHRKLLKDKQLKVTFYGVNDIVNEEGDITGEHYLDVRSHSWGNRVKWSVNNEMHLKKVIKYLSEPGKGRVAVMPTIGDSSVFFLHQALRAGIPIISSNLKSAQEVVHIQDRRDVLFGANDTVALAKRMLDILQNGVLLGRPQVSVKQYEAQWRQLLADIHARPLLPCPSSSYKPSISHEATELPNNKDQQAIPDPLITVVITHYNRHFLVRQAIESLEQQTFKNFEVLLVDDGSTDPEAIKFLADLSWRWWQDKAWRVLMEPHRYLGAARNTGAKMARGKYILFMDDDDIAKPDQLELTLRVAEITGADVVTTGHDLFVGKLAPKARSATGRYIPLGAALNAGVLRNVFGDSNMFVHRQFFLDSGGFTEEYGVGFEDYEFLARVVARDNHLEALPEPMHWYRQHLGTMSLSTDIKAGQMRFMRAYMEVFNYLPKMTQKLLDYARKLYFESQQPPLNNLFLCNSTVPASTVITETSTESLTQTTTVSTESFTSFTTTTVITSTDISTLLTTTTTSTFSTLVLVTSLQTPSGVCPCRSHKRQTHPILTSTRSTCYSTTTHRRTLSRTAKATTITHTYTPTVTCDPTLSILVPIEPLEIKGRFPDLDIEADQVFSHKPPDPKVQISGNQAVKAPVPVLAEFSPSGEYVKVIFNIPVNVEVGRKFQCDTYLEMNPVEIPNGALLGKRADGCILHFVSYTEMRVVVDKRYTKKTRDALQPGKFLVFKEGTLGNADSFSKEFVRGAIEVVSPLDPDPPRIVVDAPTFIGSCDESIHIDLSKSSGDAGRPFIDALFDFNSTAEPEYQYLDEPLRQFLYKESVEVIKSGKMSFDIPAGLLGEYTSYTISFSLWNIFGVGGTATATISRVPNKIVPLVQLEGPYVIRTNEAAEFKALMPAEVCGNSYNSTLSWAILSGPTKTRIRGSKNRAGIVLPPNFLDPGSYVLGLRVNIIKDLEVRQFLYSHSFQVFPGFAKLEILGGSRLIGYKDTAKILVRVIGGTNEEFDYSWNCLDSDRESPCQTILGEKWGFNSANFTFDPREFPPHAKDLQLQVTATHKQFQNYKLNEQIVLGIAGVERVPRVELAASKVSLSIHDKPLKLVAAVGFGDSSAPKNYTFKWESVPFCNRDAFAVLSLFNQVNQWTDNKKDMVEVSPTSLVPGAGYCFRVSVIDGDSGLVGWAYREISVSDSPKFGYCELTSNAVAIAFQKRFTVECHGWPGQDLQYRFKTRMRGDPIPLAPASPISQFSFAADVGHYLLEVDVMNSKGLVTTFPVRNISARIGETDKDGYLAEKLDEFERTKNAKVGYEILALTAANVVPSILAGQSPPSRPSDPRMMESRKPKVSLARILHVVDQLTLTSYLDAKDTGPYFLDFLKRMLPNKLPIDLRPLLLRILLRITQGMSNDIAKTSGDTCFNQQYVIQILQMLGPIYENPRGGTSASFQVNEIKNVLETCVQRTMTCQIDKSNQTSIKQYQKLSSDQDDLAVFAFADENAGDIYKSELAENWDGEAFSWMDSKQSVEFGLADTREVSKVSRLCSFSLPDLRGMTRPEQPCLGYRCVFTRANLMRNSSIDTNLIELSFRNSSQILAPWFKTKRLSFMVPLSESFQRRIRDGGKPKCIWYDRYVNSTSSAWSDEGCQVVSYNTTHVQCSCNHLTEFAIMVPEMKKLFSWINLLVLAGALLLVSLLTFIVWIVRNRRRSPKSEIVYGPPNYDEYQADPTKYRMKISKLSRFSKSLENVVRVVESSPNKSAPYPEEVEAEDAMRKKRVQEILANSTTNREK